MKKYLFLISAFIFHAQYAFCAEEAFGGSLDSSLKSHSTSGPGFGSVIFALLFVICLIYITGIIYTRLNAVGTKTVKKQLKNYKLDNIIVLSTMQLGKDKNLHVVETNGKKLLVSSTSNTINLIKDLGDDEFFTPDKNEESSKAKEPSTEAQNKTESEKIITDFEENKVSAENTQKDENLDLYKKYL